MCEGTIKTTQLTAQRSTAPDRTNKQATHTHTCTHTGDLCLGFLQGTHVGLRKGQRVLRQTGAAGEVAALLTLQPASQGEVPHADTAASHLRPLAEQRVRQSLSRGGPLGGVLVQKLRDNDACEGHDVCEHNITIKVYEGQFMGMRVTRRRRLDVARARRAER